MRVTLKQSSLQVARAARFAKQEQERAAAAAAAQAARAAAAAAAAAQPGSAGPSATTTATAAAGGVPAGTPSPIEHTAPSFSMFDDDDVASPAPEVERSNSSAAAPASTATHDGINADAAEGASTNAGGDDEDDALADEMAALERELGLQVLTADLDTLLAGDGDAGGDDGGGGGGGGGEATSNAAAAGVPELDGGASGGEAGSGTASDGVGASAAASGAGGSDEVADEIAELESYLQSLSVGQEAADDGTSTDAQ